MSLQGGKAELECISLALQTALWKKVVDGKADFGIFIRQLCLRFALMLRGIKYAVKLRENFSQVLF